jgi:hypothetical protein
MLNVVMLSVVMLNVVAPGWVGVMSQWVHIHKPSKDWSPQDILNSGACTIKLFTAVIYGF